MTTMNETTGATPGFTAHEAAETLSKLDGYEDTLNRRAGALTWMFFGMGGAGIFVTYEAGSKTLIDLGLPWLLMFLWVPWILGASLLTNGLWQMLAAPTKTEFNNRESWLASLAGTALFFVIAGILWLITLLAGLEITLSGSIIWVMVVGAFTATLATYQGKRFGAPTLRNAFVLAGAILFLTGAMMSVWPPAGSLPGLIGAGVTLLTYFAAALYVYDRG